MMSSKGSIMIGLVFMVATFTVVIYAMVLAISFQFDFSFRQAAFDQALNIAEAGVDYYRWHLAHDPDDFQDGSGGVGPYVHDYRDPQGNLVGKYSLTINPPEDGFSAVTIISTGWTETFPNIKRKVTAVYGRPTVASNAYFTNSALWFGQGTTVYGPVHSNDGIRMDGTNTSAITSAKLTYTCGQETGCWPNSQEKPGVWGNGGPTDLWSFPVPAADFGSFNVEFGKMKEAAVEEGIYLGVSDGAGYHLVFSDDGSVAISKVTQVDWKKGYSPDEECQTLYQVILSEEAIGVYPLADNETLLAEDTLWVEGTVKGKMTVAAARFPIGTFKTNIWIPDNLVYAAKDGSNRLGLVAQNDIYFSLNVPTDFEVNAALLAQTGKILRHHYNWPNCSNYPQKQRNSITIYGSIISKGKSYWNFGSGPGQPASGFVKRYIYFDPNLLTSPPAYFPGAGDFELISWKQE